MLRLDVIKRVEINLKNSLGLKQISLNDIIEKQSWPQKKFW